MADVIVEVIKGLEEFQHEQIELISNIDFALHIIEQHREINFDSVANLLLVALHLTAERYDASVIVVRQAVRLLGQYYRVVNDAKLFLETYKEFCVKNSDLLIRGDMDELVADVFIPEVNLKLPEDDNQGVMCLLAPPLSPQYDDDTDTDEYATETEEETDTDDDTGGYAEYEEEAANRLKAAVNFAHSPEPRTEEEEENQNGNEFKEFILASPPAHKKKRVL